MNIGPLARADAVTVEEITVGEPLAREGTKARRLFDSAPNELSQFTAQLKFRIEEQLRRGGLQVGLGSPFSLTVAVYGGKYEARPEAPNVFLLQVYVAEIGSECTSGPVVTKLGVASDADLSRTLQDFAIELVQDFIHQRAEYRKSLESDQR